LPFYAATERDAVLVPRPRKNVFYGIKTASMTWSTPLLASMSVLVTFGKLVQNPRTIRRQRLGQAASFYEKSAISVLQQVVTADWRE